MKTQSNQSLRRGRSSFGMIATRYTGLVDG
jgi:hypothetical protein